MADMPETIKSAEIKKDSKTPPKKQNKKEQRKTKKARERKMDRIRAEREKMHQ